MIKTPTVLYVGQCNGNIHLKTVIGYTGRKVVIFETLTEIIIGKVQLKLVFKFVVVT